MNPYKLREIYKYLTRAKKIQPDLPDVFPASKAPIPAKTQNVETIEAINRFNRANPRTEKAGGGRIGYADGPPGKLKIKKPKMTLEKQKASASPLREDYLGQLKDKRKVRTSSLDDAIEIRNIIVKNNGHISNIEDLGKKAGIFVGGKTGKVDPRKTKLALDLALDSFDELKGFKLAVDKYPNIDKSGRKFRYLDMVAKSFANHNTTKNSLEASAHLLQDNMAMIVDMGGKEKFEKGFFNLKGKITNADKKFISERVASLTGKDFNIDSVNELIEETSRVRRSEGSIASQIKRYAKQNKDIKNLYNDSTIQKLIKGDLDNKTRQKILNRAVDIVDDDVAIASRRLFMMAESMAGTRPIEGIEINKNLGNKLIDTQRIIGKKAKDVRAFSSLVYNHYAKTIDNALGTGPGKSFIGYYQQRIRNALDNGLVPDEIFSVTASGRRGMSPYAIFTQALDADVNSSIKGANLDGLLSKTHRDLQEVFQGRTYDKLNTADKKSVQELVSTFENAKKNVLKDLKPEVRDTIQLAEFDLKNPPSKSIANYDSYDKNLQKAFDKTYKDVGYSMKVTKDMRTQKELLGRLKPPTSSAMELSSFPANIPAMYKKLGSVGRKVVGFGTGALSEKLFFDLDKNNMISKGMSEKEASAQAMENLTFGLYENKAYMNSLKEIAESMGIDSSTFDSAYNLNILSKQYDQNTKNVQDQVDSALQNDDQKTADDLIKNYKVYQNRTKKEYERLENDISGRISGGSPQIMSDAKNFLTDEQFQKPFYDMQDAAIEKLKKEKLKAFDTQKLQSDTAAGNIGNTLLSNVFNTQSLPKAGKFVFDLANPFSPLPKYKDYLSDAEKENQMLRSLEPSDLNLVNLARGFTRDNIKSANIESPVLASDIENIKYENPGVFFAGGGIAKLAGVSSGTAPVRGPNPQGLLSLKNRVRNY